MNVKSISLKLLLGFFALLWSGAVWAGDVRVRLEPDLIDLGERTTLSFECTDLQLEDIQLSPVSGLHIQYAGPMSKSVTVNGKTTRTISYTYQITPQKAGDFTLKATLKYGGKTQTVSARLSVIKEAADVEKPQNSDLVFARIARKGPPAYVHEPFELEYTVYARKGIQLAWEDVFGRNLFYIKGGLPKDGLDGEPMLTMTAQGREVVEQRIFNTYTFSLKTKALKPGLLTICPQATAYGVSRSAFGFGSMGSDLIPVDLTCNSLDVEVKAVPQAGRPVSYSGAVGTFQFKVEISPAKVQQGSPVTVRSMISGNGNFDRFPPPELEETPQLKVYEIQKVQRDDPNAVCYEQAVIPTSAGVYEIPALTFSYFDTETETFQTVMRGPFPIDVDPASRQSAQVIAPAAAGAVVNETKVIERDIAYLKPAPAKWSYRSQTAGGLWWLWLPVVLPIAAAGIALHKSRIADNETKIRRQRAPKQARKQVNLAEKAMKNGSSAEFIEALWNALTEYFGDRLILAPGEVTVQAVLSEFPDQAEEIQLIFEVVEQYRYGVVGNKEIPEDEMQTFFALLNEILKKCERVK